MPAHDSSSAVGIVGLGIMGLAMARNLVAAGRRVVGHDIEAGRAQALADAGGSAAASPQGVAEQADVVLTVLPAAGVLEEVLVAGNGLIAAGNKNLIVADCGTFEIADKQRCQALLIGAGMQMLDCTISGTGAQAVTKDLVVYASGDRAAYEQCQPAFAGFARASHYVGPFGDGSKVKFVANLLVAIHTAATAEAMVLAQRAGLDLQAVYDLVRDGAGNSRMFELRGPAMVAGEYGRNVASKLELWQKDMQVIGRFAAEVQSPVPLFAASAQLYAAALEQGLGAQDMAAICAVLEGRAGITRKRGP
ncbi:MAG: NAD(P)-dependent oxidoreductase [Burkholderiales bacterium]